VLVDFGYGIDRELFQPHPAIVIGEFQELLVVVPTNSDDGQSVHPDIRKALLKVPSDRSPTNTTPIFPKRTIINLHQVRHISKNRVTKDLYCNVRNYILPNVTIDSINQYLPHAILQDGDHLLRAIMVKLAHLYAPDMLFEIHHLHTQIGSLTSHVDALVVQIDALNIQIDALREAAVGDKTGE